MNNVFILIPYPDCQAYMGYEGFEYNSCLCNEEPLVSIVGSNAYFIRRSWLERISKVGS